MKLHEFTDRLYVMSGIEQEEKKSRRLNESYDNEVNLNESFSYDFFEKPCSMLHDKLNEDAYDFIDTDPLVQSILKKYPYAFKIPKDERLIIKKEVEKRANEIIDKYRKRITKAFVEQASDYIFGSLNFHELNVKESLYRNNKVERRKNEALELNESKQGLIDHLYEIINQASITNEEIVDMLLGFMDESQLVEVIDELKLMCDIDD